MKQETRLYLVRHGETEFNRDHIVMGQSDSPLTKAGVAEAKTLRNELKGVDFAAVYTSDLARTIDTARFIVEGRDIPMFEERDLRERSFGAIEGQPEQVYLDIRARKRGEYDVLDELGKREFKFASDIESDAEVCVRVHRALVKIAQSNLLGEKILVVTHAGPIRTTLIGLGLYTDETLPMGSFKHGSYAVLSCAKSSFRLMGIFPEAPAPSS